MADPTTNIPAEEAVVRHIANDTQTVDMLVQRGVTRRWFNDPLYASVVEASIRLRMAGREVDPLSIMSFSTNGVTPERWVELAGIWNDPNPPANKPEVFLDPLQDAVTLRDFDSATAEAQKLRRERPREVRQWSPYVAGLYGSILQNKTYDPRPSSHLKGDVRDIVGKIGISRLDRAMKGGLWAASTNLIIGISNHGKSTLAYTIASLLIDRQIRTIFVTTEMQPREVAIGVLRPMGGWSDKQVRLDQVDTSAEENRLDGWLCTYDYRYAEAKELRQVVHWERPQVIIYDYLKAPDAKPFKREDQALSELIEGIREIGIDYGTCNLVFAQFSDRKATEFRNSHNVVSPAPFGSSRVYHASDQVIIMMRHWQEVETGFFKVKKDKLPPTYLDDNLLDWEFTLKHDRRTRSFWEDEPLSGWQAPL